MDGIFVGKESKLVTIFNQDVDFGENFRNRKRGNMARTQKNKATMGHLGMLKARIAKLRRELITPKSGGGSSGEGFDVAKTGDARIGFVG
ncbi:unnamed protein product [Onchocerca ochengi]|uniref:Transposase n=1 Tax=Onchocerca ochengi TaxID=42157 RepID=A0A182DY01_ONCOC|nr:unnamed protein product [Onchocerca ochengi]